MNSSAAPTRYPYVLLFVVMACLAAGLVAPFVVEAKKSAFNDEPLRSIEEGKPAYIFIGNSMCDSRISPTLMTMLSGEPSARIVAGPSFVVTWYLWLKNYVAAAKHRPKKVFIFFTDEQLTVTHFQIPPKDAEYIETELHFYEPEYDRLVRKRNESFYKSIIERIRRFYSREEFLTPVRQAIASFNMEFVDSRPVVDTREEINLYLKRAGRRFAFDVVHDQDFRPRDVPMTSTETFSNALSNSFLEPMVRVAKEKNVNVCFFRIRRAPSLRREDEPAFMEYKRQLKEYFARNNICYIDESGDTEVTDEYFSGPFDDHCVQRERYTEMFYRKYIKNPAS